MARDSEAPRREIMENVGEGEEMNRAHEVKAKLSDRAARCWSYYDGDQGAAQALDEAWAILAEAEPKAEALVRGYRIPGQRIAPDAIGRPAFEALAESLAAFCDGSF
jgi:hypothetical protein